MNDKDIKTHAKMFPYVVVRNTYKDGTQMIIDSVIVSGFKDSERAVNFADMEYKESCRLNIINTYDIYRRNGNTINKYCRIG